MKKQLIPVKAIFVVIVTFGILFIFSLLISRIRNSNFFKITDVLTNAKENVAPSFLKGRNIFTVNIKKYANYIAVAYPDYNRIRVIRIFPNRLYVDFAKRRALASVKLYRYFLVDEDGVLFNAAPDFALRDLPVITGLENKIFGPKPGRRYSIGELGAALAILKRFDKKSFREYKINKIDVSRLEDTTVFLSYTGMNQSQKEIAVAGGGLIEVKFGADNLKDKINILRNLLIQIGNDRFNIKYIDLRFKEPVIRLRNPGK